MILIKTLLKHWVIKLFIAVVLFVTGTIVYDNSFYLLGEILICIGCGLCMWFMAEIVDKIIDGIKKNNKIQNL